MTRGKKINAQIICNLESLLRLVQKSVTLCLVTVGNLSGGSVGEISLVSSVENLIAELNLVLLQLVDLILELGQLGVESLLLRSELDLKIENIYCWCTVAGWRGKKCPGL